MYHVRRFRFFDIISTGPNWNYPFFLDPSQCNRYNLNQYQVNIFADRYAPHFIASHTNGNHAHLQQKYTQGRAKKVLLFRFRVPSPPLRNMLGKRIALVV